MATSTRIEYGDWQTPDDLANRVLTCVLSRLDSAPRHVLEPTCGKGSFLAAAASQLPNAKLTGYEINPEYVDVAASRIGRAGRNVRVADFFSTDWDDVVTRADEPILVIGNPPWVTSSDLGALASRNLPAKRNIKGLVGLDARTGKSNFDVCEWMIIRLLGALVGAEATLAMLCKSAVARRVVEFSARQSWPVAPGAVWRVDAGRHFNAAVDAVLFMCRISRKSHSGSGPFSWPVYPSLEATCPESSFGVVDGTLVANPEAYSRTLSISGDCSPEWRSGLKHDCARVMELERRGDAWVNASGTPVDIEAEFRYPLLKSSDVANGRLSCERSVIVPQRALGEDTSTLRARAPKLWAYLSSHRDALAERKSSIYRGQPAFSIFGIGEYSFSPWKVAVSGLYKRLQFSVVGPHDGRPVMVDDTCYFLPFTKEEDARTVALALESELASEFFRGRVFWDAKRPISKSILQALDIQRLLVALGWRSPEPTRPVQQFLGF
ncbi:class I SAM-dependent methyltransferase [Sorangium sp. So ce269]